MAARITSGLVISGLALWWAFHKLDWAAFASSILKVNGVWFLLAIAVLLLSIPLRALRWKYFLKPIKNVGVIRLSEASLIGYFGNNVLPFRFGEVLRTYILAKQESLPIPSVFGSVVVERASDMAGLIGLLVIYFIIGSVPADLALPIYGTGGLALLLSILTIWISRQEKIPWVKGRVKRFIDQLHAAFKSLRGLEHLSIIGALTIVIWGAYFCSVYFVQAGLALSLSPGDSLLVLITTSLVMGIPAAPGFVGTYHAAAIFTLSTVLSVELTAAQAMAVLMHMAGYLPYTLIGSILYFRSHIHLREVQLAQAEAMEAGG